MCIRDSSTGIVVRGLRNSFTKQFLELERTGAPADVLNALAAGRNRLSAIEGDTDNGSVQVGQSLNALTEIECVQMLIRELMDETVASIQQANELLGSYRGSSHGFYSSFNVGSLR